MEVLDGKQYVKKKKKQQKKKDRRAQRALASRRRPFFLPSPHSGRSARQVFLRSTCH